MMFPLKQHNKKRRLLPSFLLCFPLLCRVIKREILPVFRCCRNVSHSHRVRPSFCFAKKKAKCDHSAWCLKFSLYMRKFCLSSHSRQHIARLQSLSFQKGNEQTIIYAHSLFLKQISNQFIGLSFCYYRAIRLFPEQIANYELSQRPLYVYIILKFTSLSL